MLMYLFLTPLIASVILFFLPAPAAFLKRLALLLSLLPAALLAFGWGDWIGSSVQHAWLPALSIDFYLHVDGVSLLFIILSAIIVPISIAAVRTQELDMPNIFYGLALVLEGLLIGFFAARDLVLFTLFYEAMLIPVYFIINLWGGPHRQRAALKFIVYMIAGSTLMVAAVLALYFTGAATFNLDALSKTAATAAYAPWICAVFLLAFAVKTPLFPFHAWLPDAYYQASTSGTILLSALLSKAGIYGFLRIGWELFPQWLNAWSPWLLGFAIAGVFYGGLAAWMQKDYKRLIAYSSLSHVNFVLAGLFIWSQTSHTGAVLQAFNHGITITGLFLVSDWLAARLHTTAIGPFSGVAAYLPRLCWLTLLFVLSAVALPGLNSFVGEILIFVGLFGTHPWATAFLATSVILSVIYMLRWMQKVYFETPSQRQESWKDLKRKEFAIALPLAILILWVGIYPSPFLQIIQPASEKNEVLP